MLWTKSVQKERDRGKEFPSSLGDFVFHLKTIFVLFILFFSCSMFIIYTNVSMFINEYK